MEKKLLTGNEAIALGAIHSGVQVVSGFSGSPASETIEAAKKFSAGSIRIEHSVNDLTALETASEAAVSGARSLVIMNQTGLNSVSGQLINLKNHGIKGGMVIACADDPGNVFSRTEQDTRYFSKYAGLSLFDPSTPEETYSMILDAFALSQEQEEPVLLRLTMRVCYSCACAETNIGVQAVKPCDRNILSFKGSKVRFVPLQKGIATGGISYAYAQEALYKSEIKEDDYKLLKISTYPFPETIALKFLEGLSEVLVIEELDPVIEDELVRLCGLHQLKVKILGKRSGNIQTAKENTPETAANAINLFFNIKAPKETNEPVEEPPPLPVRSPVMCSGCPYRAALIAVKEALEETPAVFSGGIGCYASPLRSSGTFSYMRAELKTAQDIQRTEPDILRFTFIGEKTFFHSGIQEIINAVNNQNDIIFIVLDNSNITMKEGEPYPCAGVSMTDNHAIRTSPRISPEKIIASLNVSALVKANPFNHNASKKAVLKLISHKNEHKSMHPGEHHGEHVGVGVRVLLFKTPYINADKKTRKAFIDISKCNGCAVCLQRPDCPAISQENGKAVINPALCAGCGVCIDLCKRGAVKLRQYKKAGGK